MDTYERKLIERLKHLGNQKAPDELKERVLAAIAAEPTLRIIPRRRRVLAGVVGAGLAAAAALALWAGGRGSTPAGPGAHQVAQVVFANPHESVEVRDADELRAWFTERLGAGFDIPDIEDAHLVGGRLAGDEGTLGAIVDFEYHGERLTYVVSENLDLIEMLQGQGLVAGSSAGQEIVMWLENWTARAVVAEMPRQELEGIAAQCRNKALS
jgi:anti-sigma factor RsiW